MHNGPLSLQERKFDVIVVGAGVHGLSAAYYLSQKRLKVALIEQYELGHSYGSSHGRTRNIRIAYGEEGYVRLMRQAWELWRDLAKQSGELLIHPNLGCFGGAGPFFETYLTGVAKHVPEAQILTIPEAKRFFPQFLFSGVSHVVLDPTAGLIAAQKVLSHLARLSKKNGVTFIEKTQVQHIDSSQNSIVLQSNRGHFTAEKLILTAGHWIERLVPALRSLAIPVPQQVGYFSLKTPSSVPNWSFSFAKEGKPHLFYGMPDLNGKEMKISLHMDQDEPFDAPAVLQEFIREQFAHPLERWERLETCYYTICPNDRFILDFLPGDRRVVVGSACSGHAFKFAPLIGRILSDLALDGKTDFNAALFQWPSRRCSTSVLA